MQQQSCTREVIAGLRFEERELVDISQNNHMGICCKMDLVVVQDNLPQIVGGDVDAVETTVSRRWNNRDAPTRNRDAVEELIHVAMHK